jgi:hypothetical protein
VPLGRRVPGGVVLAAVLLATSAGPSSAQAWQDVLQRAAEVSRTSAFAGEVLLVSFEEPTSVTRVRVSSTPGGELVVGHLGGLRLQVGATGGELVDDDRSVAAVPGLDLGRPCTVLEVRRRTGADLRERLWVDDASGLVVRRETFDGGSEPVRMATYLSLDLTPPGRPRHATVSRDGGDAPSEPSAMRRAAQPVDAGGLAALREAGWEVPGDLPEGYEPLGAYAVDAGTSQPLQVVYGDGLYAVSVFQQPGRPDWASLPPGAEELDGFDFPAYTWPGASPTRIVWEAHGATWSLVGDAPPSDLRALLAALPNPEPPGLWQRLGRGLGRLWRAMSPW